ncbi:MAG TPA: hypothetical protein VJB16_06680 [archaeon]|nr:hypothetical protein [archaeon]
MQRQALLIGIVFIVLASGCTQQPLADADDKVDVAIAACRTTCAQALAQHRDLSAGPCLLDPVSEHPEWVCDVAHDPREAVDNDPANQCASYRSGASKNFVEVAPDCELIRGG